MRRVLNIWRNVVGRSRLESELDEELASTFDHLVAERIAAGEPPDDARRTARRALGSAAAVKDRVRDVRAGALVDAFLWDVRYGSRLLRRNPVFALTAAVSLAIGIGAATSIFTVANGLLLRAAPGVSDSDRLVDISRTTAGQPMANPLMAYRTYLDVVERMTTVAGLYIHQAQPEPMTLGPTAEAQRTFATIVSANYFELLGIRPVAGRLFNSTDANDGDASRLVVLSHALWLRQYGADPGVVGSAVLLGGDAFQVIGVAPEGFWGTSVVASDIWVLISARPFDRGFFSARGSEWGMVGGRLKPGVSRAEAAAELDTIAAALAREYGEYSGQGFLLARASPIPPGLRFVLGGFLALLLGLVSLVLLVACANVAGVLLARAVARRREIAVRVAIGAGRARLIRQLLTETLLLFLLGGAAGLMVAQGATTLLLKLLPVFPVPIALSLPVDARVLAVAAAVSLAAAVLAGLAPALHVSKTDVVTGLKDESTGSRDRLRLRGAFVVAQVAFSILLVVAAGILGRAMTRVAGASQMLDPNVAAATIDLEAMGYTETTGPAFVRDLQERLESTRGVESATLADQVPLQSMTLAPMRAPGVAPPDGREFFAANWNVVDVGYFDTLRLPLLSGRDFTVNDFGGTAPVAIVSESGARLLWPGENPVGRFIERPSTGSERAGASFQVVGVVRDLRRAGLPVVRERRSTGDPGIVVPPVVVYVPLRQQYRPQLTILLRMADGERADRALAAAIGPLNADAPRPMNEPLEQKGGGPVQLQLRIAGSVAGTLGIVGVLLAAMGIYGVTAYTVARRTREIGIRIAMGAERSAIAGMVLRQAMMLVAAGAAIGLVLSLAGGRLLKGLLFGAPSVDPLVYAGAALLFLAIGLAACYLPARRAMAIDAMDALRCE